MASDDNIYLHAAEKSLLLKRMTVHDGKVMGAAVFELRRLQSIASRIY